MCPKCLNSYFQAGRKNISQALHLLCLPWEATLTQTLYSLRRAYNAAMYSARVVRSPQHDMLRDSRQPIYSVLLGWRLITIPKTESSRQFISSSSQHLNTNCGSEWWIKHVLYQIFFFSYQQGIIKIIKYWRTRREQKFMVFTAIHGLFCYSQPPTIHTGG